MIWVSFDPRKSTDAQSGVQYGQPRPAAILFRKIVVAAAETRERFVSPRTVNLEVKADCVIRKTHNSRPSIIPVPH
jgi:hypothetical protein